MSPLKKGKKNIGKNIEELKQHGYPAKVAQAIALKKANIKIPKKKGNRRE